MKKLAKISVLFLAAALFFAGCSNSSGDSGGSGSSDNPGDSGKPGSGSKSDLVMPNSNASNPTKDVNLKDGLWHMDALSKMTTKITIPNQATETKVQETRDHIEMQISGDDVTIIKATEVVYVDGERVTKPEEEDITEEMKKVYTSKAAAEDPENATHAELPDGGNSSFPMQLNTSAIQPDTKIYTNQAGTEYKITVDMKFKFSDLLDPNDPMSAAMLALLGEMDCDAHSDIIYTKKD